MTTFNTNKRALFRRLISRENHLRPPWSIGEYDFVESCVNCSDCISACPESILVLDSNKHPRVNFQLGECTFCGDCVDVCQTGALNRATVNSQPWNAKAVLNEDCLGDKNTLCRSCGEVCEHGAIVFPPSLNGIIAPEINRESCTGCGACVSICPTDALNVHYQ